MPTTARLLQRGFDSILAQFPLQLQQILHGILVVGVDGYPLTSLRLRIDCIQSDRDEAIEVCRHSVQSELRIGPGAVVIEPASDSVWLMGLNRMRQAVYEELNVLLRSPAAALNCASTAHARFLTCCC